MQKKTNFWKRGITAGLLCLLSIVVVACGALVTLPPPAMTATGSTAITQAYPTPSATQTLYNQSLTRQTAGWAVNPVCTFSARGLSVQQMSGQAYICLVPLASPPDVSITVTVQQNSGSMQHAYGIVFRHSSPHNYDFFGIDSRGHFTLTVVVNDIKHVVLPFTANSVIRKGVYAVNELQVIVKGQGVTMLVNGTPVAQATLSAFVSGVVGVRGINDGSVLFRQLVIVAV